MGVNEKGCTGIHCTEARVVSGSSPGSGLGVRRARTQRFLLKREDSFSGKVKVGVLVPGLFQNLCV